MAVVYLIQLVWRVGSAQRMAPAIVCQDSPVSCLERILQTYHGISSSSNGWLRALPGKCMKGHRHSGCRLLQLRCAAQNAAQVDLL